MQKKEIIDYIIAVLPLVFALYLEISHNLTLKTLNTTKVGAIVVLLISISVMCMFIKATYDAYKHKDLFLQ